MTQSLRQRRELGVLLSRPWWERLGHESEEAAHRYGREHGSLAECRAKFDAFDRARCIDKPLPASITPAITWRSAGTRVANAARSFLRRVMGGR